MADTTFRDIVSSIYKRFKNNWDLCDVVLENNNYVPTSGNSFAMLYVKPLNATQKSLGPVGSLANPLYRVTGAIQISIFTPVSEGAGLGLEYASEIATIYRGKEFDDILCYAPTPVDMGEQTYKTFPYYRIDLNVGFKYDKRY